MGFVIFLSCFCSVVAGFALGAMWSLASAQLREARLPLRLEDTSVLQASGLRLSCLADEIDAGFRCEGDHK